jgi:hypothetical protein
MNFSSEISKLLTNQYFLYFILFLAVTNVFGYLVTNKINAVIFFALVSLLTYQFSKNMAVILLVAIVATNFMMANKIIREGLENPTTTTNTTTTSATTPSVTTPLDNASQLDPELSQAVGAVQSSSSNDDLKKKMQQASNSPSVDTNSSTISTQNAIKSVSESLNDTNYPLDQPATDPNNMDLNQPPTELNAPEGFGGQMSNNKRSSNGKTGPRLDYAATIEQSYGQLDQILGGDSIKQLTKDTQNLMAQQQNLFNTMNQMVPVLEGAQNMLQKFDIGGITNSLNSIKGLGILGGEKKEQKN